MSQSPPPGSGFSPTFVELAVLAIFMLAVTWIFFLYFGPMAAMYAQFSQLLAYVRP
jgi:hypothetical protein